MWNDDGDAASWAQSAADGARRLAEKNAKRLAKVEALLGIEPEPPPPPPEPLEATLRRVYSGIYEEVMFKDMGRK